MKFFVINIPFFVFSDLKKPFKISPQSIRVEAGGRAEITCSPPLGVPTPKIHWLKNGSPLLQDSSVLVTGEGSVLITHASMTV